MSVSYIATIEARGDAEAIEELFAAEAKEAKSDRSRYTVAVKGGACVFSVAARDSVALRATLTGITKLLTVYERSKGIEADDDG
ncbi:hypothetical protein JXB02_06175 [Candidatus Woesearchaeota archaeon]|nr:hypothetical protein [Candidatus Woesearchaeota archaeon]